MHIAWKQITEGFRKRGNGKKLITNLGRDGTIRSSEVVFLGDGIQCNVPALDGNFGIVTGPCADGVVLGIYKACVFDEDEFDELHDPDADYKRCKNDKRISNQAALTLAGHLVSTSNPHTM